MTDSEKIAQLVAALRLAEARIYELEDSIRFEKACDYVNQSYGRDTHSIGVMKEI